MRVGNGSCLILWFLGLGMDLYCCLGYPPSLCVLTGTNRDKCDSILPQPWRGKGLKGVMCVGRCMCFIGVESLPVMVIVRGRIKLHALLVGKGRKVREKRF